MNAALPPCPRSLGRVGWAGAALIAVFWPLNWLLPGPRTAFLFFPLWLGYILFVDGLVRRRASPSMIERAGGLRFAGLFLVSAPAWWLFELINRRTQNWEYVGAEPFSDFEYVLLCSVSFSTVMPAVFITAELARTWRWIDRLPRGRRIQPSTRVCLGLFSAGAAMLVATLIWPRAFYPLVWGALVLLFEPINIQLGRPHLLDRLKDGDWRPIIALSMGALVCGFFWELWNFYSFPKWKYHTPGAQFWHVFEMPLLGFVGYLPFALELYSLRNLVWPAGPGPRL